MYLLDSDLCSYRRTTASYSFASFSFSAKSWKYRSPNSWNAEDMRRSSRRWAESCSSLTNGTIAKHGRTYRARQRKFISRSRNWICSLRVAIIWEFKNKNANLRHTTSYCPSRRAFRASSCNSDRTVFWSSWDWSALNEFINRVPYSLIHNIFTYYLFLRVPYFEFREFPTLLAVRPRLSRSVKWSDKYRNNPPSMPGVVRLLLLAQAKIIFVTPIGIPSQICLSVVSLCQVWTPTITQRTKRPPAKIRKSTVPSYFCNPACIPALAPLLQRYVLLLKSNETFASVQIRIDSWHRCEHLMRLHAPLPVVASCASRSFAS